MRMANVTDNTGNSDSPVIVPRHRRRFGPAFLRGLTASGVVLAGALPGPKAPSTGIHSDWEALGQDMSTALNKYATRIRE